MKDAYRKLKKIQKGNMTENKGNITVEKEQIEKRRKINEITRTYFEKHK